MLDLISEAAIPTLELALLAMLLSVVLGVGLGIVAAVSRGSISEVIASLLAFSALAVPNFVLAIGLIYVFSLRLSWLPASGYIPFKQDPVGNLKSFVLPSISLGAALTATFMRQMRAAMIEVYRRDYVRTARAKGLRETTVIFRHCVPPALIPIVTLMGLLSGALVGGAVITESVFAIPGVGRLLVNAVEVRDLPLAQGIMILVAVAVVASNVLVDMAYGILDPRIRRS